MKDTDRTEILQAVEKLGNRISSIEERVLAIQSIVEHIITMRSNSIG